MEVLGKQNSSWMTYTLIFLLNYYIQHSVFIFSNKLKLSEILNKFDLSELIYIEQTVFLPELKKNVRTLY